MHCPETTHALGLDEAEEMQLDVEDGEEADVQADMDAEGVALCDHTVLL